MSQLPTGTPLVYSGDVERLHVSAALCFFSCCCMLPQLDLKCHQSLNNLAKTQGRDQNAGDLHTGSPPIRPAWPCLGQRVLGLAAAHAAAPRCPPVTYCILFSGLGRQRCSVTG